MNKKTINKEATISRILDKCNTRGYKINMEKFNAKSNCGKFIKEVAEYVKIEIVYN